MVKIRLVFTELKKLRENLKKLKDFHFLLPKDYFIEIDLEGNLPLQKQSIFQKYRSHKNYFTKKPHDFAVIWNKHDEKVNDSMFKFSYLLFKFFVFKRLHGYRFSLNQQTYILNNTTFYDNIEKNVVHQPIVKNHVQLHDFNKDFSYFLAINNDFFSKLLLNTL